MNKRLLGIDFGEARTGIAICDSNGLIATGLHTVSGKRPLADLAQHIADIAHENRAVGIILGLPLNMDDSESEKCMLVRELAELIKNCGLPVTLWDERCTTLAAQEILRETKTKRKKRKQNVDALAAQILLQDYLDNGVKHA